MKYLYLLIFEYFELPFFAQACKMGPGCPAWVLLFQSMDDMQKHIYT